MELVLIRHGQTVNNREDKHQGWQPVPLSELGVQQAENVARILKKQSFDRIIASDLLRTKQTAEILFRDRLNRIEYSPALREINTDVVYGVTYDEMFSKYGEVYLRGKKSLDYSFCGGESAAELNERVRGFLKAFENPQAEQRIAVVTHGGVLRAMLGYVLGMSNEQVAEQYNNDNCGLSYISYHNTGWRVDAWNCRVEDSDSDRGHPAADVKI